MKKTFFLVCLFTLSLCAGYAQKGKDGNKIVTTAKAMVNEYTTLTSDVASGSTFIKVSNSGLNDNGRFAGTLAQGDLLMIIQMQGASINGTAKDSTWGQVTSYNNCGLYEFLEVSNVPDATTINISCSVKNNYTAAGHVQVIRVPRYSSLTVNANDTLTCDTWDGSKGGMLAVEVSGNTIVNASGAIDATGKGFRGGLLTESNYVWHIFTYASMTADTGGQKGESIAGYQSDYTQYGGMYGRGAPANGGGGGNAGNSAGGGGGNAGNISGWTGNGNPDTTNAQWIQAWNLEYNGFANSNSSGGGRGGYCTYNVAQSPFTTPPGSTSWGTVPWCYRENVGGKGGRPLDYSTGRLFLGGGGGSGQENNNNGGGGGNGGGMIYLLSYGTIGGSGTISSNGQNGLVDLGGLGGPAFGDGSGGAGAGGTVILQSTGAISAISVYANGGLGGNEVLLPSPTEGEGAGGGGGGGYIATSNGTVTRQAQGGVNGNTDAPSMAQFNSDGATKGGDGLSNEIISGPSSAGAANAGPDTSICSGESITLAASGGSAYSWSPSAGLSNTSIANPLANPTITTVYVVTVSGGSCSSLDSVKVTVAPGFMLTTVPTNDTLVCSGSPVQLLVSGATNYSWSPLTNLSCSTCSNPLDTANNTISYTVTGTNNSGCSASKQITVNVSNLVVPGKVTAIRDTICQGTAGNLTLAGNSSNLLQWQSSTDNVNFSNVGDTTTKYKTQPLLQSTWYRVTVGTGSCSGISDTLQLYVPPALTASFYPVAGLANQLIFNSDSSAGNIRSYHWDFGDGGISTDSNPSHTYAKDSIYYVCLTLYDGSNCSYTFCRYSEVTDGVPTISATGNWIIYPNPFSEQLTIAIGEAGSSKQTNSLIQSIEMYDVLGQLVINKNVGNTTNTSLQLDVSSLAKGMYYVMIRTADADYVQKVVKQ